MFAVQTSILVKHNCSEAYVKRDEHQGCYSHTRTNKSRKHGQSQKFCRPPGCIRKNGVQLYFLYAGRTKSAYRLLPGQRQLLLSGTTRFAVCGEEEKNIR